MKHLFKAIHRALSDGQGVVLCSVVASSGSCPRGMGAKMAVFCDGSTLGSVGGGEVELRCTGLAQELLKQKCSSHRSYCLSDSEVNAIGMICGGNVTVQFTYFDPGSCRDRAFIDTVLQCLQSDDDLWLIQTIRDDQPPELSLYGSHGRILGDALSSEQQKMLLLGKAVFLSGAPSYYAEPLQQSGCVYIFGGGHVAKALVPILNTVGFSVTVMDDRADFANQTAHPAARQIVLGSYAQLSRYIQLTDSDYAVVMTPGHQQDYAVLAQVLKTDVSYIGCIGSRKKAEITRRHLLEDGFSEDRVNRIHCPIGLEIYGNTPEEIAVSIAAELIRERALRNM